MLGWGSGARPGLAGWPEGLAPSRPTWKPDPPLLLQLHEKFEHLKRVHQEEKRKVEEKRRELEEETNAFNRRKAAVEALQSQALHTTLQQPLRKDKDKKK